MMYHKNNMLLYTPYIQLVDCMWMFLIFLVSFSLLLCFFASFDRSGRSFGWFGRCGRVSALCNMFQVYAYSGIKKREKKTYTDDFVNEQAAKMMEMNDPNE